MQIQVKTRAADASALQPLARERLRFALRRLAFWVQRIQVSLEDDNGPRQGQDKRCRLRLHTRQGHALVLTEVADDWRVAFERALARLVRSLSQLHERHTHAPRLPQVRRGDLLALPGTSQRAESR